MNTGNRRDHRDNPAVQNDATVVRPQGGAHANPSDDDATRIVAPQGPRSSNASNASNASQGPQGTYAAHTMGASGDATVVAGPAARREQPALRAELGDFVSGVANPIVRAANPLLLL